MKKLRKIILCSLLLGQITVLSGCGTITRGESPGYTYRGFEMDKEVVSNPYFWIFSFGIYPIFSILSMPVDVVVDTVLYPYDSYQEKQLRERIKNMKSSSADIEKVPDQK